jgi:hypothetical protein
LNQGWSGMNNPRATCQSSSTKASGGVTATD